MENNDFPHAPQGTCFARPELSPQRKRLNVMFMRAKLLIESKVPAEARVEAMWYPTFSLSLARQGMNDALIASMDAGSGIITWEPLAQQLCTVTSSADCEKAYKLFRSPRRS